MQDNKNVLFDDAKLVIVTVAIGNSTVKRNRLKMEKKEAVVQGPTIRSIKNNQHPLST